MTKFNQIMKTINDGISFSWSLGGFDAPDLQDKALQVICDPDADSVIGYHTQVFLGRVLYFENLRITYMHDDGKLKIYY